jgi:glucokinase
MPPAATPTQHLGLDLGATNLKWAVAEHGVDGAPRAEAEWRTLDRGQVATLAAGGAAATVSQLAEVGREAIDRWPGIATAGIGVPGLYDPASGTTRMMVNLPGEWDGRPVRDPLKAALGVPVALINDARAFGLAELRLGAARGSSSMIGFTLGTGVGGVFAVDGRVHLGHDGTGGELGHQTIDPDGPDCNCGNFGCLEAFARADRIAAACGTATAEEAVERARKGDAAAIAGLERVGHWLGIGIANMITVITPDRVVIGGGIAAAGDLILAATRDEIRRRVFMTSLADIELVTAELGTWAGAIGAAIHGAEAAPAAATRP